MGRGARLADLPAFLALAFVGFAGRFLDFDFLDFITVTSEAEWRLPDDDPAQS
jgi:hypothetical protein